MRDETKAASVAPIRSQVNEKPALRLIREVEKPIEGVEKRPVPSQHPLVAFMNAYADAIDAQVRIILES